MPVQFQINKSKSKILVWYLSEQEEELNKIIQLSEYEVIKLSKISNKEMRCSFLAIRIMIKNLGLSEIKYMKNGKPMIENGFISISHSGSWVGVQYSTEHEVGFDLEKINTRILKIKNRFLSEKEQLEVCQNEIEKMILCWSAKEAIFKKHGGETVFFKDHIEIIKIDKESKSIIVEVKMENKLKNEILSYTHIDSNYVLVYTN